MALSRRGGGEEPTLLITSVNAVAPSHTDCGGGISGQAIIRPVPHANCREKPAFSVVHVHRAAALSCGGGRHDVFSLLLGSIDCPSRQPAWVAQVMKLPELWHGIPLASRGLRGIPSGVRDTWTRDLVGTTRRCCGLHQGRARSAGGMPSQDSRSVRHIMSFSNNPARRPC